MNKNIKIFVNYFLGPLLFIVLSWSLYSQVVKQPDLSFRWQQIKSSFNNPMWGLIVLLMFINWGLETKKWKLLIRSLETITWSKAIQSVLAGCSVTMLTPNRSGEFGGRLLFLKPENRIKGIAATIFGSMTQLMITILAGAVGWLYLQQDEIFKQDARLIFGSKPYVTILLVSILLTILALIFLLLFRPNKLIAILHKISVLKNWVQYVEIWGRYTRKDLLSFTGYSALRYIVFILQYVILLRMMAVDIQWPVMISLIALFYLLLAIVPTIGFTELPVRGALSSVVIGLYSANSLGIQVAGLSIWLVNLVMPAIAGSIFIMNVKLIKDKNELV